MTRQPAELVTAEVTGPCTSARRGTGEESNLRNVAPETDALAMSPWALVTSPKRRFSAQKRSHRNVTASSPLSWGPKSALCGFGPRAKILGPGVGAGLVRAWRAAWRGPGAGLPRAWLRALCGVAWLRAWCGPWCGPGCVVRPWRGPGCGPGCGPGAGLVAGLARAWFAGLVWAWWAAFSVNFKLTKH